VHCVECPRSYHVPRNFESTHRNTQHSGAIICMYCM
jgi:hypothetical protein